MKKLELIVVVMKKEGTESKQYLIERVYAKWDIKNTLLTAFKEHEIDLEDQVDFIIDQLSHNFTYSYYGFTHEPEDVKLVTFILNTIQTVEV